LKPKEEFAEASFSTSCSAAGASEQPIATSRPRNNGLVQAEVENRGLIN